MRKKMIALVAALLLGMLGSMVLPAGNAEARYKKPGCGECSEGTLDLSSASCPGAASNCTECTVCG